MKGIITWFVDNSVAANLLMFVLLLGGSISLLVTYQEEFPNIEANIIVATVPYLGAAPEEVEEGVCIRIEEAVNGTEGVEKIASTAAEGACTSTIFILDGADPARVTNEVKSLIDGISTFPRETEKPIITEASIRSAVLSIAVVGNTDEVTLKEVGRELRDELALLPGISQVFLSYARDYEIAIEMSEEDLRRYGLTIAEVANAIRNTSVDMPGGTIKTQGGEILLRTKGQAYTGIEYEDVVVRTLPDGSKVYLSDVANVVDGFQEGDLAARFDGESAVMVKVYRVGKEDIMTMAATAKRYLLEKEQTLPAGLSLEIWSDESESLRERLSTLVNTATGGLILVVLTLTLFLRFRLAVWVAIGIPIALLGAIMTFPYVDISISSLTVMAFILVLGVVVDDAIVVGERVFAWEQKGVSRRTAAIEGTYEVSIPVIFGVLTTVAAFVPLLLIPGRMGDFFSAIPTVVILCLIFSIIESQMILPTHLAHRTDNPKPNRAVQTWLRFQGAVADSLTNFATNRYRPFLEFVIQWRYAAAATAVAAMILVGGMIAGGHIVFAFFPSIEGDRIFATLEMPEGTPVETTLAGAKQIEAAATQLKMEVEEQTGVTVIRHTFLSVGARIPRGGPERGSGGASHMAEVALEIAPLSERGGGILTADMAKRWRELAGDIPDAVELSFDSASFSAGKPISFELRGRNVDDLRTVATLLRGELARYDGIFDLTDSFRAGKQEIKLSLKPEARNFGLTLNDLGRQVRQAFYGEEAQRIQRGADDIRVMVRYPEEERRSIGNLEDMRIRTADGSEVPFMAVANIELGRGYSSIRRLDGTRLVEVSADVDRSIVTPERVLSELQASVLPKILADYPGITYKLGGEQEERAKAMLGLLISAILALFVIYTLLAIPLKSYLQPLVIMSVIPFGAIGAIFGHWLMDWPLMFFSSLGIVALSGVVVNASLVLVDYVNRRRRDGEELMDALLNSGVVRFRPIILTSTTTFVGLLPLLANANPSTFFVIPMAISLAFGVLFATFITLLLVPCLYLMQEDFLDLWHRIWRSERRDQFSELHAKEDKDDYDDDDYYYDDEDSYYDDEYDAPPVRG